MTRSPRARLSLVVAAGLLLLLPLTGCAVRPIELQAATAQKLQGEMLDITQAAAAGDFADAQSLLSTMQANLRTATTAGQVSADRAASIQTAINLVSADLTVEIEAAAAQAADEQAAAQQAAAQAAAHAAAQAAAQAALAEEQNAKDTAKNARDAREACRKDKEKDKSQCD